MDTQKTSIVAIAILAFFVFWGGAQLALKPAQSPLESESFLDYVIPKLQTFIPKFSLWDRKFVDRRKLAPKLPAATATPMAQAKATAVPAASPTATPKPTAQAAATATPNPSADNNSATKPLHADKDDPAFNSDPAEFNPYTGNNSLAGPAPSETPTPESQVEEWKRKIYSSPSKQTMNDLIFEFQTGKVSRAVFYEILEDLMKDSSSDIQKLSVFALAATPSLDSLHAILTNKDHLSTETSPLIKIALDGYTKPEKLRVLELALKSESPTVILGSMPLIVKIGSRMTLWTADYSSQSGGRDRRGPTNRIPKNDILDIVETLNHLEDSPDRLISQAARDTLNQLNYQPPTASRRE